jgi:tight adherence protein C
LEASFFLILGLLLAGLSVYLVVSIVVTPEPEQQALSWASGDEPTKSKSGFVNFSRPLVHRFALIFSHKIKAADYRKKIDKKIATAGLAAELNTDEFIGMQILWGILFPVVLIVLNFTLELGYSPIVIILLGSLGAFFPHFHCNTAKKARYRSVSIDLPFFIDLLALSTEAGLDFIGAIQRVVDKAEDSVLGEELGQVLRDIKLGRSRSEALRAMADRLDIPEITSFVVVLIDADATGASIGHVLKQQSVQMRIERFARAEKAGAKASQLILMPLVIFIIPAVMIMVFGPVVLNFMGQGGG